MKLALMVKGNIITDSSAVVHLDLLSEIPSHLTREKIKFGFLVGEKQFMGREAAAKFLGKTGSKLFSEDL